MAERNCRKCFHFKACKEVASHSGYRDISYTESQCKHFTPTADVVEAKHGKWVHIGNDEWCCTNCGEVITTEGSWETPTKKYCHECGAKMNGERKENG